MKVTLSNQLPEYPVFVEGIHRTPGRGYTLSPAQTAIALKNTLRYIPVDLHERLAPESLEKSRACGHIHGYHLRPVGDLKAKPIDECRGNCTKDKASQVMVDNNLCFDIASYPYELVTYGETGQVYQDWMQYRLIRQYLEVVTREQTLVIESGHPLGFFHSRPDAPRIIITNPMMVGMLDNQHDWHETAQVGVTNYGQITVSGWAYIGLQGIVHSMFNTLLNAGRLRLDIPRDKDLSGHLFVSSGLGGMGGAQSKATKAASVVSIITEVDRSRVETRYNQGWAGYITTDLHAAFRMVLSVAERHEPCSMAYHGNVVDLLEYAVQEDVPIDPLSDQASCHAVYEGGCCPAGVILEDRTRLLHKSPETSRRLIDKSLHRHFAAIKKLVSCGIYFFGYGNSFMKIIYDAGVKETSRNGVNEKNGFIWPSCVEDVMGPGLFDYGYGSFRRVCLSDKPEDLAKTDRAVMECVDVGRYGQDPDDCNWIKDAGKNQLVVGTQACILYQDAIGRLKIALRFNEMVRDGEVGPIMLGRDHYDVSGIDSSSRETSNIRDDSNVMADMVMRCLAGSCARGISLVALHNGGGVGIGKAINGGFGMVCDGSSKTDEILRSSVFWDVMGGVARRSWVRNERVTETSEAFNLLHEGTRHITMSYPVDKELIKRIII